MRTVEPHELNRKFRRNPAPVVALFEVTQRCNLACLHCIRDCPTQARPDRLSTGDWKRVQEDLADLGGLCAVYTGGEPLMRDDIEDLMRHARGLGLALSLKTNATLLTEERAESLWDAGLRRIETTIYGMTPASHEGITGIEGSLEMAMKGIEAARTHGIEPTVAFFVIRGNAGELASFREWSEREGIKARWDGFLITTDSGRSVEDLRPTLDEMDRAEKVWPVSNDPAASGGRYRGCTMGRTSAAVTASGEVLPCVQFRHSVGRITERPFAEIWRDDAAFGDYRGFSVSRMEGCPTCPLIERCRPCPGQHLALTGSPFTPSPRRCILIERLECRRNPTSIPNSSSTPPLGLSGI